MRKQKKIDTDKYKCMPTVISELFVHRISKALLSDVSIFRKIHPFVDFMKTPWMHIDMEQIFGESMELNDYKYFDRNKDEQIYIRSLLKYYDCIYKTYLGESKHYGNITKYSVDRIYNIFKKKYFNNFMDIIYNKYKNENVNYFSTSIYKEALEVISSTFINDKLNYYTEINLKEIIQGWLKLDLNTEFYEPTSKANGPDKLIKVKTCKDLFLNTCIYRDSPDKDKHKQCLDIFTESWKYYVHSDELNPLAALIAKVFFIAVFNAMLDRVEFEGSEISWKIRSMEKNFYTANGCGIREHAQNSMLTFIEDAKNYKQQHDHVVVKHIPLKDDYSIFDCFICPIISETDYKHLEIVDRYTDSMDSECRIAKLLAPYQVMYSKMSSMESQMLFALNMIHNTKNIGNILDGRINPLWKDPVVIKSNDFYKNKCFMKKNVETIQQIINNIAKRYNVLYDHSTWSFTSEINEVLKKFHQEHPEVADNSITMVNLYNALKSLIGSYEEYLYISIREPIGNIYKQFTKYPYTMDLTEVENELRTMKGIIKLHTELLGFQNYLNGSDKERFIDFLNNSAKIVTDNGSWSCYETVFIPIIKILNDNAHKIIEHINEINKYFSEFESTVCYWYLVMMNRSKYITGFDINEYKKYINNSRISILQDRVQELFK